MSADVTAPSVNKSRSRGRCRSARGAPSEKGGKDQPQQEVSGGGDGEQPSPSQSIIQEASKRYSLLEKHTVDFIVK